MKFQIVFNESSTIFRRHICCFSSLDEKLAKLAPLIAKFEKVTLNGSQKMTAVGWEEVR